MAELQPRIDEVEGSLAEVKGENERHAASLAKLRKEHEEFKERALVRRGRGGLHGRPGTHRLVAICASALAYAVTC